MNDCIWSWIVGCVNCRCNKYISANSEKGSEILEQYELDVEKAIEPVKQDFLKKHYI